MISFRNALWAGVVVLLAWLLVWPLVMNAWAASHWTKLECQKGSPSIKYIYKWGDHVYISGRRDFWSVAGKADKGVSRDLNPNGVSDGVCWVNPSDPQYAVHYLDAPTNWSGAAQRIIISVMLLMVAGILQFLDRKRAVKQAEAARPKAGTD